MLRDLRGLSKDGAEFVAGHLVAAGSLADEEPELAWLHARAARARGGRIAVVRETVGLVAYRAGEWAEAIGELRAARRMGGGPGHLAVMADSERALGHPERAIELSRSAEADDLDEDAAIELAIVVAGARADLGQIDAALAHLERIGWREDAPNPRIAYAYADLLLQAGRRQEALTWFVRAADADADEETDAGDRLAELSASLGEDTPGAPTGPEPGPAGSDPRPASAAVVEFEQGPDSDNDNDNDAGKRDESEDSATAGPETVAGIAVVVAGDLVVDSVTSDDVTSDDVTTDVTIDDVTIDDVTDTVGNDAGSAGIDDVETDDLATTFDADVSGTDNSAGAAADGAGANDDSATATDDGAAATDDSATATDDGATATDDQTDADTFSAPEELPTAESDDQGLPHAPDARVTDTDTGGTTGASTATADPTAGTGDVSPPADPLFVPPLFSDDPLAGDR